MSQSKEPFFITNEGPKELRKRVNQLIGASQELKFLVGFFYFCGLKELYEGLKNNSKVEMKVLVGMQADYTAYGLVEYAEKSKKSDEELTDEFLRSIRRVFSSEEFDEKDFYEQAKFFIELIKDGRLIIRKTREPNHAKLYIFLLKPSQVARTKLFITGSSNLTYSGLTRPQEFNVEISDYGVSEAERYFDELWENSVEITENLEVKEKLIYTLQEETLLKELSPFSAYTLVLKSYIETYKPKEKTEAVMKTI